LIHVKVVGASSGHPLSHIDDSAEVPLNHSVKPPSADCGTADACPVAGACACGAEGHVPCRDIAEAHHRKLEFCDQMEAIADALPWVDRLQCLQVANQLVPLLREAHRYEEEEVFPVFERAGGLGLMARIASVRRLKAEHIEDECAAQDLTELLLEIGHGRPIANPEALGFMLRAFFDSLKRHIAFEREHVVPIVAERAANPVAFAPKNEEALG
jgi:Hemerythrin HHE cation binding domain